MKKFERPVDPALIVPYETNYAEGFHSQYEWFSSADVGSARWSELRATFGARGACALLTEHPQVDGIVCFDDQTAFGVLRACAQLGRRVPDDLAVIGCNDIPLAVQATPPLTTQRIPRYPIGKRAVELLVERINGNRRWYQPMPEFEKSAEQVKEGKRAGKWANVVKNNRIVAGNIPHDWRRVLFDVSSGGQVPR